VSSRRNDLLDAAISLLGEQGVHGLTHRAVDTTAGVPAGSTANYFRSRDALLDAVVERFAAREKANWDDIALRLAPASPDELAGALADFAHEATGPSRTLTLARYAILVEAANRPALRAQLGETGARVNAWATNWMRIAGSANPERDTPIVMNCWTGLVLHQLAIPDPAFDPLSPMLALTTTLLPPPRPRRRKS
jgi:DNA-binding transcriptional regulator YbjK